MYKRRGKDIFKSENKVGRQFSLNRAGKGTKTNR